MIWTDEDVATDVDGDDPYLSSLKAQGLVEIIGKQGERAVWVRPSEQWIDEND